MWIGGRGCAGIREDMFARISGVTVSLMLPLLGCAAPGVPAADDTAVAVADARPEAADHVPILVTPTPDAAKM